ELKLEKDGLDGKLAGLLKASKNLDHLIKSQRRRVQRETTRAVPRTTLMTKVIGTVAALGT
nr:hypothetical protein [Tanacetum cinerariifolium]